MISTDEKGGTDMVAGAGQDNLKLAYQGLAAEEFTSAQRPKLFDLVGVYVGYMDDGHAAVKMKEVEEHLDDTYFYWIGETKDSSAFYYRVHSPVVLIEYDAQSPLAYGENAPDGRRRWRPQRPADRHAERAAHRYAERRPGRRRHGHGRNPHPAAHPHHHPHAQRR
ncbi:DUF3500 domain-containing protein [Streptomyces sp. NPDC096191]|uniref:DUF3500 domain-containing protein n=1 Tax=Streptomyces sp. NPDC096191 TaxID=3155426 RepID=UPI0033216EC6